MGGIDGIVTEGTVQMEGADTHVAVMTLSESNHTGADSQGVGATDHPPLTRKFLKRYQGDLVRDDAGKSDSQSARLANY